VKQTLNILYFLTLPVIAIGGLYLVMHGAVLYLSWSRGGPDVSFGDAAAAASSSIKGLAIGLSIIISTFVSRAVISARLRKEA
jgi:hypothetical protein